MSKLTKLVTAGKVAAGTLSSSVLMTAAATMANAQSPAPAGAIGTVQLPDKGYADNLGSLISSVLTFVMVIAALLVLFYLILGGIEWITSGGDKGKTEAARNKITSAVIGIIVLAAAYAILQVVLSFLGFSSLNDTFSSIRGIQ